MALKNIWIFKINKKHLLLGGVHFLEEDNQHQMVYKEELSYKVM